MGLIGIRATVVTVAAAVALCAVAPAAMADTTPPPPPPPPGGGGSGSGSGGGSGGGGGSTTVTPPVTTTTVTPPETTTTVKAKPTHHAKPKPKPKPTMQTPGPTRGTATYSGKADEQPVQAIGGTDSATSSASRRPWLLLAAGVVLLGLAMALLLRPTALRIRRRGMPSASVR
jgi:outer membrane biosynthesis protein TonB